MSNYPRTEDGFAMALGAIKTTARWHPKQEYALYVDLRTPDRYSVSLAALIDRRNVAPGTAANLVDADGNFTPLFDESN